MALVRDPAFWKRFSVAVHAAEDVEKTPASSSSAESGRRSNGRDDWLAQQHQKKRRWRCIAWSITLGVALLIAAIVLVIYYLVHVSQS